MVGIFCFLLLEKKQYVHGVLMSPMPFGLPEFLSGGGGGGGPGQSDIKKSELHFETGFDTLLQW